MSTLEGVQRARAATAAAGGGRADGARLSRFFPAATRCGRPSLRKKRQWANGRDPPLSLPPIHQPPITCATTLLSVSWMIDGSTRSA